MTEADVRNGSKHSRDGDRDIQPQSIEPSSPTDFGRVQVWWGNGKGKTTAALGMGLRAVGHGYRVHLLQFMKGGAPSVEPVRGEYNAIEHLPGFTYENVGHYGWHAPGAPSEDDHAADAQAGLERARTLIDAVNAADLSTAFPLDGSPEEGVHMLVLDEILYAANRGLIDPYAVVDIVERKPDGLELVLTGGHDPPDYLGDRADLITNVRKVKHHFDEGASGRRGTEY